MLLKEIISGESNNVEFKEMLPDKHIKYMKTVVAFANGKGGKIIFGVKDDTREIVGINNESIFKTIDSITNAISDLVEPKIIPNIILQTINDKTLIVVEIESSKPKPFYIKSEGILRGVYVRSGATTRPADDWRVRELLLEGSNRYYDQQPCYDMRITEEDINNLCHSLKETAIKNCKSESEKESIKDITQNTLLSWGVLVERDGVIMPTNAFALLTGHYSVYSKVQCAVFKGTIRNIFIDRREFDGPIQNQVEEVYKYVLSKINLGAKIEGLYRHDIFEMPPTSIRELIANAITHRSYLDPGNIQVALYDNRLEITSPGMLAEGVTINKMKEGYSKVRNRAIAYAFAYMRIIEAWGSGIPKVIKDFKDMDLEEPEFIDYDGDISINLYRSNYSKKEAKGDKNNDNSDISDNSDNRNKLKINIINILCENPSITQKELAVKLNVSKRTVIRILKKLVEDKVIVREGNNRTGKWIVK